MKKMSFLSLAVAGLALTAPAQAAVVRTAPASAAYAGAVLLCEDVIAKSSMVTITIEARDYNGNLIDSIGPYPDSGGGASSWAPDPGAAYCKFIIAGSSKSIRAQAVYVDPATGHRMVAIPAR
jgi:hypothetical protein